MCVLAEMSDFASLVDLPLTFDPGAGILQECANISITSDEILEEDEAFDVVLTTNDTDVMIRPNSATVTIVDDDGMPSCCTLCL